MAADIPTYRIGTCEHCGQAIAEIRDPHSGAGAWYSHGGDFGCDMSPDATDDACGPHEPRLNRKLYRDVPARPPVSSIFHLAAAPPAADPTDPFSLPEGI